MFLELLNGDVEARLRFVMRMRMFTEIFNFFFDQMKNASYFSMLNYFLKLIDNQRLLIVLGTRSVYRSQVLFFGNFGLIVSLGGVEFTKSWKHFQTLVPMRASSSYMEDDKKAAKECDKRATIKINENPRVESACSSSVWDKCKKMSIENFWIWLNGGKKGDEE